MASFIWKVKVTWSELGTTRTCHENVVAATCLDAIDDVRNDFSDRVFINSMECESIGSIGTLRVPESQKDAARNELADMIERELGVIPQFLPCESPVS